VIIVCERDMQGYRSLSISASASTNSTDGIDGSRGRLRRGGGEGVLQRHSVNLHRRLDVLPASQALSLRLRDAHPVALGVVLPSLRKPALR
jgi:hypothetical protein